MTDGKTAASYPCYWCGAEAQGIGGLETVLPCVMIVGKGL